MVEVEAYEALFEVNLAVETVHRLYALCDTMRETTTTRQEARQDSVAYTIRPAANRRYVIGSYEV